MQRPVWIMILLLLILHQDNWLWNNDTLVGGFMPIGLFYHACISLAAGAVWWIATKFYWPAELDLNTAFDSNTSEAQTSETNQGAKK